MKHCVPFILFFLAVSSLFGGPTRNDVIVATAAVTDSAIVNCAGFLATPQYVLPGCVLLVEQGETLPSKLVLTGSDIGSYLSCVPQRQEAQNWLQRFLSSAGGPLDEVARVYLTVHDWKEGEAVLDGTLTPRFPEGMGLAGLMRLVLVQEHMDPIETDVDVWVRGKRLSVPVHVKGSFLIRNVKGEGLTIEEDQLLIDD
ncbi:MAG: hypothetical protein WCQ66_03395 [Sphaerochaetaceae bacterium]|jgi:hypothetical protein